MFDVLKSAGITFHLNTISGIFYNNRIYKVTLFRYILDVFRYVPNIAVLFLSKRNNLDKEI